MSARTAYSAANPTMMSSAIRTARPGCVPYPHPTSRNSQSQNRPSLPNGRSQLHGLARRWFTLNR